mmetsp:Transcript_69461/g.203252  ORF Transcript_69461/g.203252 Transcript_69461/m.203252 type:complete len:253 (+) Transcript_69461:148-906(+)
MPADQPKRARRGTIHWDSPGQTCAVPGCDALCLERTSAAGAGWLRTCPRRRAFRSVRSKGLAYRQRASQPSIRARTEDAISTQPPQRELSFRRRAAVSAPAEIGSCNTSLAATMRGETSNTAAAEPCFKAAVTVSVLCAERVRSSQVESPGTPPFTAASIPDGVASANPAPLCSSALLQRSKSRLAPADAAAARSAAASKALYCCSMAELQAGSGRSPSPESSRRRWGLRLKCRPRTRVLSTMTWARASSAP